MAICSICAEGWCGCGGGRICGDCRRKGLVRKADAPAGPTARPAPSPGPVVVEAPRTYVNMPGMSPTSG